MRQGCADQFLRKSAGERATSLEGRLEATQAAVGLVQRRQAEASAEEQLAAMRKQHEEAMAALKQQAELQRQQLELMQAQYKQMVGDGAPRVQATMRA